MNTCNVTFNSRPKIDIIGDIPIDYYVEVYEFRKNVKELISSYRINTNNFVCYLREWYGDYQIDVFSWDKERGMIKAFDHRYNDEGKKVLINLDTNHINEALVWLYKAIEYRDLHKCELHIKSQYKNDIEDVDKSITVVDNINERDYYAIYHIGKYDIHGWSGALTDTIYDCVLAKNSTYCSFRNPRDWHNLSIDDIASDILGLNSF